MAKYKVADQVRLVSGGPTMTVSDPDVFGDRPSGKGRTSVRCQWFAGKKLEEGVFPEDSLLPAKGEEKGAE